MNKFLETVNDVYGCMIMINLQIWQKYKYSINLYKPNWHVRTFVSYYGYKLKSVHYVKY